ncbi:hypothetical protein [Mycoplasmopsis columboralis]|uniref:Uncharacterized protein n=1 Tax=Mycoplasmopsis columboralis TaxID=171282 RepID=A0A449B7L1_9BACT|nr:hypothetical protein [Mycoplasmopsis columboralis]VEU76559.1 Uncharacterised protein [Mycoplasmopsis columboralis]
MNKFLKALKKKIAEDQKKLSWILFLDKLFSTLILLLNLSVLGLAIAALVILIRIARSHDNVDYTSLYILMTLVIFIIASFVLTLVIAVYKVNGKFNRYKKVEQTAIDLSFKYKHSVISKEEFIAYLKALEDKLNKKEQIAFKNVIQKQLTGDK